MSAKFVVRTQVYWDMDEIAAHIQKHNPQAALRFLENVEATFQSLAEMPGIGSPYAVRNPHLRELRCFPVTGFRNHLVFYRPTPDGIEVIRVLHGARNIAAILRREK